jgi:Spy/CpxP family protein refolding chaperone
MKRTIWAVLILAFLLCLGCAGVYAAERIPKGIFKDLNLTADQEKQMKGLFERQKEDEKKKFRKIRGLQDKMDKEFLQDRPDGSRIRSIANDIKKIQSEMLDEHFDYLSSLRNILTPAQFKKFIEKGKKMREKGGKFKGFWQQHHSTREGFMPPPPPDGDERPKD